MWAVTPLPPFSCPSVVRGAPTAGQQPWSLANNSRLHRIRRVPRLKVDAAGGGSSGGGRRKRQGRARLPGMYEVEVITPPPRSLGIHALEPNTGCGDEVEVEGEGCFVVSSVVLRYRLERGKYVRDHNRLEVQPTGRYFLNKMLDGIYESNDSKDT